MSRKILVKAREVKVGHQKIEFQHNKKGPWHSSIADVWTNSKKKGDLKVSHLMNRDHPKTEKPFTADELLGKKSRHGIRFVGGPNSAVQEAYPHHSLGGADEGTPSVPSSSETSTPDSGSAQTPSDSGQRSLEEFGLTKNMLKSHALGLTAAWEELVKAITPENREFEALRPYLEAKMSDLLRQGYTEDEAAQIVSQEIDAPVEEYDLDTPYRGFKAKPPEEDTVQQITPPVPAQSQMRGDINRQAALQAAREEGGEARGRLSPEARRAFEQGQM